MSDETSEQPSDQTADGPGDDTGSGVDTNTAQADPEAQAQAARQAGDQADHAIELNLGPCHYCEEPAVEMGTRDDEAGWIPVCEEHKGKASEAGFDVHEAAAPVSVNADREREDAEQSA